MADPMCGTTTIDWHPPVPGEVHGTFRNPGTGATEQGWYCLRCAALTSRMGWWTSDDEYRAAVEAKAREMEL